MADDDLYKVLSKAATNNRNVEHIKYQEGSNSYCFYSLLTV